MPENKVTIHLQRYESLLSDRASWMQTWKKISDYILPRAGMFSSSDYDKTPDQNKIYDSTPTIATERLASGIHGGLTSPSRPWFRLRFPDERIMNQQSVREWLVITEKIIYNSMAHSNFYDALHECYVELVAFGTTCLFIEEGKTDPLVLSVVPAGQYVLAPGIDGKIDTLYRKFRMQLRQLEETFGANKLPQNIRDQLDKFPYQWEEVLNCVQINKKYNPYSEKSIEKQYESLYFLADGHEGKYLRRGFYSEIPFCAPRWAINSDQIYGNGPCASALPDAKLLQEMTKTFLKGVHKTIDPPLNVPSGYRQTLNVMPGGISFYNGTTPDSIKPLYQVNFDLAAAAAAIEQQKNQIKTILYNDLFIMDAFGNRDRVTANEINARREDKMIMLGPVIERLGHELLDPLLTRVVGILSRKGIIPPPPESVLNSSMTINYISTLAQAQRAVGTAAIRHLTEYVGGVMQMHPEAIDTIDWDEAIHDYAEMIGAPIKMVRGDEVVAMMRQKKAEAAQAQAQLQQYGSVLDNAQKLGEVVGGE